MNYVEKFREENANYTEKELKEVFINLLAQSGIDASQFRENQINEMFEDYRWGIIYFTTMEELNE